MKQMSRKISKIFVAKRMNPLPFQTWKGVYSILCFGTENRQNGVCLNKPRVCIVAAIRRAGGWKRDRGKPGRRQAQTFIESGGLCPRCTDGVDMGLLSE